MRIPSVRAKLQLPELNKPAVKTIASAPNYAAKRKRSLSMASVKEWWAGMKERKGRDQALRNSEHQGRADHDAFVKAGQGKIPVTYRHNPKLVVADHK